MLLNMTMITNKNFLNCQTFREMEMGKGSSISEISLYLLYQEVNKYCFKCIGLLHFCEMSTRGE